MVDEKSDILTRILESKLLKFAAALAVAYQILRILGIQEDLSRTLIIMVGMYLALIYGLFPALDKIISWIKDVSEIKYLRVEIESIKRDLSSIKDKLKRG